jgi:hypothetical protein
MSSEKEGSFEAIADKRTRTLLAHEQAFCDEAVDRLAHSDARDGKFFGEITLGRQCVVRPQHTAFNRVAEPALYLLIERQGVCFVERPQNLRQ